MYGLVLEGGGAKGAYHMGAYKALMDEGIEIRGVAGTSIGALNGAMIVQGEPEKAYELWREISYSKVIAIEDEEVERWKQKKIGKEDITFLTGKILNVLSEKGLDISPMKDLLVETIDEDKIRESGKDFGIVTISLTDLKPVEIYIEDIPVGKLSDYLLASAYFPAFKRDKIDGKNYIDGGLYNNLPVNLLRDKGYKDLIIIRTHGVGIVRKVNLEGLNTIVISPNEDLGGTLDFDRETARYNLKLGYYDGLKALRKLKGYSYYIESQMDEDYFIKYLLNLEDEKIIELAKILKVEGSPCKRVLFEQIIPKIFNIVGGTKESNYEDLFFLLLEKLAGFQNIERFKVYTYDELLNQVKENLNLEEDVEIGPIDKLIGKVDLLSLWGRNEIIKEVGKVIL